MQMTQHELFDSVRVVRHYDLDTLGAPFKVTLKNGVTCNIDLTTKRELVEIPDMIGLIATVVRARLCHPRKLGGDDLKFVRKALGVRAKTLASLLDVSPEHYSRCEVGTKTLALTTERSFRLFTFWATVTGSAEGFLQNPGEFEPTNFEKLDLPDSLREIVSKLVMFFMSMKIEPVVDAAEELHLEFVRRPRRIKLRKPEACLEENKVWSDDFALAEAA